jgi:hypothetical protein
MEKGIIYLIQPYEFIGKSIYKIGYSGKTTLDRCHNGYKKGSRYLCINECINPTILENKIKKEFNNKFKLEKGREYFEGNEENIKLLFRKLVEEHEKEYPITKEEIEDNNTTEINTASENKIELKCNYCDNIYKSNSARILHYRNNHNELYEQDKIIQQNNNNKYKCVNCDKIFISRQAKHYHIKKCKINQHENKVKTDISEISEIKNMVLNLQKTISLLSIQLDNSNIINV